MNNTKDYGENLSQTAKRRKKEQALAEKMKGFVHTNVTQLVQRAITLLDNPSVTVRCELEDVQETSLHFLVYYIKDSERIILGHEMVRLPNHYSIGKWDGKETLTEIEFAYCPPIGRLVETTVQVAVVPG